MNKIPYSKKKFALLYGIMIGDGCLSKTGKGYSISISGSLKNDFNFFLKIQILIESIRQKKTNFRVRNSQGKVEYNFSDKKMFHKFVSHGFPIGKKRTNIHINQSFKNYEKEVIAGIFSTDGCLVIANNNKTMYPRVEMASISKNLLKQIRAYLEQIGISSGIYVSKKYTNSWNTLYRLQANGKQNLFIFEKRIGFINPKHKEKFNNYLIKYAGEGI